MSLKLSKNVKPANDSSRLILEKEENLIKVCKIDLGFGVDKTLKKLRLTDLVSKAKVTKFKKECQQLLIAMVSKLIDFPNWLSSDFLLSLSVLQFSSSRFRSTVLDRRKIVLTHILKLNMLSTKCCDKAISEFKLPLNGNVIKFKDKLMEFPRDKLYFDTQVVSRFKKLASVVALILTLSHGQVSVERGFSQNNNFI